MHHVPDCVGAVDSGPCPETDVLLPGPGCRSGGEKGCCCWHLGGACWASVVVGLPLDPSHQPVLTMTNTKDFLRGVPPHDSDTRRT